MIKFARAIIAAFLIFVSVASVAQDSVKHIIAKRITSSIKIDGILDEPEWKSAQVADKFITLRPAPFKPENPNNATQIYFLYNDEGLYIGGYLHEKNKDSISSELIGRDGFGNNDFLGVIFDTYNDKLNGFEYFVTPLGEQMDAKQAPSMNGNSEDFSWNAVWKSASKINNDGWSFEMFLPYSAIRFGKKKIQNWGLNIVRRRQKSGEQLFWNSIDPNKNGFLTQEGMLLGLEDIKPPLRLQFSPYFSTYQNHDDLVQAGTNKNSTTVSGGMDIKYGLNQAMTLDMTLIPDFGQVVTDNKILNLSPFDIKFTENRTFFTEGAELFNKGDLFYSRKIGRLDDRPLHYWDIGTSGSQINANEIVDKNPVQDKLINATKISGRSQNGLGIGVLNAITAPQYASIVNTSTNTFRKYQTDDLTNYNVFVLDQTLKHNSSVSFVNTNVLRAGSDYDANVSAFLIDLNDKKNKWNGGANVSVSQLKGIKQNSTTGNYEYVNTAGYYHSIYFGKVSGHFNFYFFQELFDNKYDKSDLGYFTNNNSMQESAWLGYNFTKPTKWFNSLFVNTNFWYTSLVKPLDQLKRSSMMYSDAGINMNVNINLKNLWQFRTNIHAQPNFNDFYEPRTPGWVFQNKGNISLNSKWTSNQAKKYSWGGNLMLGAGGIFNRKSIELGLGGKIRFSKKFSIDISADVQQNNNSTGWAYTFTDPTDNPLKNVIIFSRRNLDIVENVLSLKYNFNTKMGLTLRARHYWSKVNPQQFYQLNKFGYLVTPDNPFTINVNQNYNILSADMVYTWQFAQGSFINLVWKNIGENYQTSFEKNYFDNFSSTAKRSDYNNLTQFNSFSLKVIYFIDYLTAKNNAKKKLKA